MSQRKLVSGSMSGSRPATKELPLATKSIRMSPKNARKMRKNSRKRMEKHRARCHPVTW